MPQLSQSDSDAAVAADAMAVAQLKEFKTAMRSLAATVTLVTAVHDGRRSGLCVTAACSLSMDPPTMLVCVNRSSNTHDLIVESGHFAVNMLSDELHHRMLANRFADPSKVGEQKFAAGGPWCIEGDSAPLLEDSLASVDCTVMHRVEIGTHTIFIGRVRHVINHPEKMPLLYTNACFAGLTPIPSSR